MPAEFGIIYQDIFHSSLMKLPIDIRYVWDCLLVLSGPTNYVRMGREAIAHRTHIPIKIVSKGIDIFLAPDPDSTTRSDEGRRIALIEPGNERAGYRILNKDIWRDRAIADRKIARQARDTMRKRVKRAAVAETKVNILTDVVNISEAGRRKAKEG